MINQIYKYIKCPYKIINYFGSKGKLKWIPDKTYLKLVYRARMGKKLNIENPITYNEKLQWLKLNDRNPAYISLVDKFEVRKYISKTIGEEYLIPILGVYDCFDEIDFDKLPEQFVLKCTHNSGGVIICKDKNSLNKKLVKKNFSHHLKQNYYYTGREWPYKYVKPRIICEELLYDLSDGSLKDYKIFCFNGVPKSLMVVSDRDKDIRYDYFDIDFNHQAYTQQDINSCKVIAKPENYDKMVDLARLLSISIPHVRIDFYELEKKIYFGEMTFFNESGFRHFDPDEYDEIYGSWIRLSVKQGV